TLLEAMSSGVCAITTPVGLALEIVEDGVNAALVPFNDAGAVAKRTLDLAKDAARRAKITAAGRATVVRTMDVRIVAPQVARAYEIAKSESAKRGLRVAEDVASVADLSSPRVRDRIAMMEDLAW